MRLRPSFDTAAPWKDAWFTAGLLVVYAVVVAVLFHLLGVGAVANLAIIPASLVAWRNGTASGVLAALGCYAAAALVFTALSGTSTLLSGNPSSLFGLIAWMLAALAVGTHSRLFAQLQGELQARQRLEAELRDHQERLEEKVEARSRELREAQDRLHHADKLQLLGQLAGSIAHDFNNALTVVAGHAELLGERLQEPDLLHHVKRIQESAEDARERTRSLLSYVRKGRLRTEALDFHALAKDVADLGRPSLGPGIRLDLQLKALHAHVLGDPGELRSTLLNLLLNACDALPKGGCITLRTTNILLEAADAEAWELTPGPYLQVEVEDDGCGIPAEHLSRIFEPFFTTKGEALGTGLGLPAVEGAMRSHQGGVRVHSQVDLGTTFQLLFPALTYAPPQGEAPNRSHPSTLPRRILVVDDEEMVGAVVQDLLEASGARVTRFCDPRQAVAWFTSRPSALDAAVLDLHMEAMDGVATLEALRAVDPQLPVLVLSGHISEDRSRALAKRGVNAILAKPCRREELVRTLEQLLPAPVLYS